MKKIGLIAGASFLAGAVFFALSFGFLQDNVNQEPVIAPQVAHAETLAPAAAAVVPYSFVSIVRKVKPAVVKVVSEAVVERRSMFGDDFFDQFFNAPRRQEKRSGSGSGFFISADGYILTNNHVVQDAVKVKIFDIDKKEYTAKIIGTDPKTDLALLKVSAQNVPFIPLGDSSSIEVGEWVLAIGNPFNQDLTVTSGIISAKGRQLGMAQYEDFLQTDAAINMGNSGGPLINMKGEAIGINSTILTPSAGSIGIGFAIPTNMAKKVVADLKTKGKVVRGWFGIQIGDISESDAKDLDLQSGGVLVQRVEENSPAQKAGLKRYDLITAINGRMVKSAADLQMEIANSAPGDEISVTIFRGKDKQVLKVKVSEAPDSVRERAAEESRDLNLGMTLVKNTPALAREYELKTSKGLVVEDVERGGTAAQNGMRPGDVILAVNRTEVSSVEQFKRLLAGRRPGSMVLLLINRDGDEVYLRFALPE
ncbi:MAG: Do family serine endopeptidase [Acidobacteria bacterium]|jgi:serine protease Do|nr:Do family serine endopeptidase [Acidobacteriota bacterium]